MQNRVAEIKKVREGLTKFYETVSHAFSTQEVIIELMADRKYYSKAMFDTLTEIGVFKIDNISDILLVTPDVTNQQLSDWGLLTQRGEYILKGRYVFPIRDIAGTVVALVGWDRKGGTRKYVTTPTKGFSRDTSFFNFDSYSLSWEKWNGLTFLVEGIFDAICLRSLGFPAIANQGLEMSAIKSQMLTRYRKVVAISDNDASGRSVNPITNRFSGRGKKFIWDIPTDHVFSILPLGVEDIDDLVRDYNCYELLLDTIGHSYLYKMKLDEVEKYEYNKSV